MGVLASHSPAAVCSASVSQSPAVEGEGMTSLHPLSQAGDVSGRNAGILLPGALLHRSACAQESPGAAWTGSAPLPAPFGP